ncbi:MAG: DUF1385 domain-containing protein, partial [Defluviitaleaceae bacterium]|nr:DUF1385 domain-containing protein [Defluviitaleaceae bacterium]
GKKMYAMAVRRPDGQIEIVKNNLQTDKKKPAILKWPIVRGVAAFCDSLSMGYKTLSKSAEISTGGFENGQEEETSKFEKFLIKKFGDKLNNIIMSISAVIAVLFAVALLILLPTFLGGLFKPLIGDETQWLGVIEGLIRISIFLLYVFLISFVKDIKRVYQYHGAEHKTINCHEAGAPLTTESIKNFSRLHKRCGTSFLLIVMVISMIIFLFIRTDNVWIRFGSRIILIPFIAGLSYEVIKWAGRRDNFLVRLVSFPGLCLQRLTTGEPDNYQIETAVAALNAVLENDIEKPETKEPQAEQ